MDSITLIETSPPLQKPQLKVTFELTSYKDYKKPLFSEAQLFRCDVRNKLNPNLRHAHQILLALPLSWLDVICNLTQSNEIHLRTYANTLIEQAKHTLFPSISSTYSIFNIHTILSRDPFTDFLLWFDFFQLPKFLLSQSDKISCLKSSIYTYLTKQNINVIPFMLISCRKSINLSQIRKIHSKIRSKVELRPPTAYPLFTLHLQDEKSPYVFLWMDTENLCSFNLGNLNTVNSKINFANTLLQFINYASG